MPLKSQDIYSNRTVMQIIKRSASMHKASETGNRICLTFWCLLYCLTCYQRLKLQGAAAGGGIRAGPYIDLKDAQWVCTGDLVALDIETLRPTNFVVYHFGVFGSNLLHTHNDMSEVTILVASNLPPNNYTRNCFRHSFHWLPAHEKDIVHPWGAYGDSWRVCVGSNALYGTY